MRDNKETVREQIAERTRVRDSRENESERDDECRVRGPNVSRERTQGVSERDRSSEKQVHDETVRGREHKCKREATSECVRGRTIL